MTGTLSWRDRVHLGAATTIIADGATAWSVNGAVYLRGGRDFINHGTVTQNGNASLVTDTADSTTEVTNAAGGQWTMNLNNGRRLVYPHNPTATMNFLNAGTLTKTSSGQNYLGYSNGTFNLTHTGTIEVEAGTLTMSVNATSAFDGPVDLAAGTTLSLPAGTATFEGETPLPGEGLLQINGGTVTLNDDATLSLVELTAGTLVVPKSLSVADFTHRN